MAEEKENVKKEKNLELKGDTPVLKWEAPEFIQHQRSREFYLIVILIGIVLAGILAWQGIWTGAGLVAIAVFFLIFASQRKPLTVAVSIFQKGIVVGERVYDFNSFKSFHIAIGEMPKIKFQFSGRLSGQVSAPVEEDKIDKVREILSSHLPEEQPEGEDLNDIMNRFFRF